MFRRLFIAGALAVLAAGGACEVQALGIDSAVLIEPDAPPRLVRRFMPAGGPLARFESRPGAWYALLYVPVAPQWPIELSFWPPERRHWLWPAPIRAIDGHVILCDGPGMGVALDWDGLAEWRVA